MTAIKIIMTLVVELYKICLRRCTDRLELAEKRDRSGKIFSLRELLKYNYVLLDSVASISRENSVEVIHLDVLRTFPTLGFFQEVQCHYCNYSLITTGWSLS